MVKLHIFTTPNITEDREKGIFGDIVGMMGWGLLDKGGRLSFHSNSLTAVMTREVLLIDTDYQFIRDNYLLPR